jgi:hypothetical protein
MAAITPAAVQYVARLQNVAELILLGYADLAFWQTRLQPANLVPCATQGYAHIQISATAARWRGFHFREFTISVGVGEANARGQPRAYYLAHAFNSLPALAWLERTFFHTPYYPGVIKVRLAAPARLAVLVDGTCALAAAMSDRAVPLRATADDWFGPVHLPERSAKSIGRGEIFYARLSGRSEVYACPATDTLSIKPVASAPVFQWLCDSHFTPHEWRLRSAAAHAKSKTYRRPQ